MIIKNIALYLKFKGLAVSFVEKEINVSNGTLSKPIANNKTIKTDTLEKFLNKYTDINKNWLLTGNGEMLTTDKKVSKENDSPEIIDLLKKIIKLQEENAALKDALSKIKKEQKPAIYSQYVADPKPKLTTKTTKP